MRVQYSPKKWRPDDTLDAQLRSLFTLLHVIEPVEDLTLTIANAGKIRFKDGLAAVAAFCCEDNEIVLPAHADTPLSNLMHEYQHAIDQRNGIDRKNHRGFPQMLKKLHRRLLEET